MSFRLELGPGDTLRLFVPNAVGKGGHWLTIPATLKGLKLIRQTLSERASHPDARIGAAASPIQHMVDAWLRADRAEKEKELEGLDLEL